ncbi:hypothetical protein [Methanoculleus receptaculi]|uniref:Uncharacterized protein n=1 Tax=Methanoculleus receptaculi TaxID=394967 RepID=A0AAX4FVC9_9EURY|nr:hypothetical protein [Methanoculleus receptaculi]WOX57837.1 hypothetical protein R6Y96_00855 [Methanoculleus receptaculi]
MKTAQGIIRTLEVVAALILLTVAAGCFDRPLTPGHRTLEGDVWVLKLDDAGDHAGSGRVS